jgi:hypothetical protein
MSLTHICHLLHTHPSSSPHLPSRIECCCIGALTGRERLSCRKLTSSPCTPRATIQNVLRCPSSQAALPKVFRKCRAVGDKPSPWPHPPPSKRTECLPRPSRQPKGRPEVPNACAANRLTQVVWNFLILFCWTCVEPESPFTASIKLAGCRRHLRVEQCNPYVKDCILFGA